MSTEPLAQPETSSPAPTASARDLAKAARYTLLSMNQHRSIGQLALQYGHKPHNDPKIIAYAMDKSCYYGPRFLTLDRFQQAFVVMHETMHHVLGHIDRGALIYKREGSRFSPKIFNIACDAPINWMADRLPHSDATSNAVKYGVQKCQALGIVNWGNIQKEVRALAEQGAVKIDPIFDSDPSKLRVEEIYYALMKTIRQVADSLRKKDGQKEGARRGENGSGENQPNPSTETPSENDLIERLAGALNAHDDLFKAIKEASARPEGELVDHIQLQESALKRIQAGAGSSDAILSINRPDGNSHTPWPQAMRRIASSALLHRPMIDPSRPSRRVVSAVAMANNPRLPEILRPRFVPYEPRLSRRIPAKHCVVIIDTSGSMLGDKQLLGDCINETRSICKRVATDISVIFADAEVCDFVHVEDSIEKIEELEPKGGGGTDFRPAITLAEAKSPDLIIYLTDLCGRFPDEKPKCPIIWGYPPEYEKCETPYGIRLPLNP